MVVDSGKNKNIKTEAPKSSQTDSQSRIFIRYSAFNNAKTVLQKVGLRSLQEPRVLFGVIKFSVRSLSSLESSCGLLNR